ncbi:DUF6790 family protein [Microbacterium sp. RU33B]|uniref:DUF6790 family protein n=1 Tax=Microbacterium sp. RU33B TaxID=1907390 RepID=UPI000967909E|nr:DUF6790 family protein [Microbacterium sp. RU33B]SIT89791.1 hypothetical protein SAMN05880545_3205 [Microbacterium sp. RU33B]
MIATVIAALIGNYMTTLFVVGLIVAAVKILSHRGRRTAEFVSGTLLNSFVIWAVGVAQTVNFVMHSFFGDYAAKTIGWAQSPFQLELAISSLGVGVMAFILGRRAAPLIGKVAIIVAVAIFGYGAAAGHIYQMVVNHDYAANNTGLLLFSDIAINTVGLALMIWHIVAIRRQDDTTDASAFAPQSARAAVRM